MECILKKFSDNTTLEGAVNSLQGWEDLGRGLGSLEHWTISQAMNLIKGK